MLTEQGVESLEIETGSKVADLAAGSFAAIAVVEATDKSQSGTVKEVRSRCYFVPDPESKKPRYLAPARVILFKA
jgi:hypothetical protein